MGSSFWTVVGVVLTLAMIVLSAFINYSFGYSLGTTETNARIFGGVSVVAVGVMAVLPLRISRVEKSAIAKPATPLSCEQQRGRQVAEVRHIPSPFFRDVIVAESRETVTKLRG